MVLGAALIVVSSVLFVQMGLADAILGVLHLRSRITPCVKCISFWSVLLWSLISGHDVLHSVAASFISSYVALWVALLVDGLTVIYNKSYEYITQTDGASEDAETDSSKTASEDDPEVPEMQEK